MHDNDDVDQRLAVTLHQQLHEMGVSNQNRHAAMDTVRMMKAEPFEVRARTLLVWLVFPVAAMSIGALVQLSSLSWLASTLFITFGFVLGRIGK